MHRAMRNLTTSEPIAFELDADFVLQSPVRSKAQRSRVHLHSREYGAHNVSWTTETTCFAHTDPNQSFQPVQPAVLISHAHMHNTSPLVSSTANHLPVVVCAVSSQADLLA